MDRILRRRLRWTGVKGSEERGNLMRKRRMSFALVILLFRAYLYGRPRRLFVIVRLLFWYWVGWFARCLGTGMVVVGIVGLAWLKVSLLGRLVWGRWTL